jgi:DNA-binding PadR family transcriptional regulator
VYGSGVVSEMREPTFLVLAALAGGPQHGYGVMREVGTISGGRVSLRAGTLYAALERLVEEGLVVESGQEVVGGRLRRYYTLTDDGATALESEVERMRANANQAASRLRARTSPA